MLDINMNDYVKLDFLTNLCNRASGLEHIKVLIEKKRAFSLFYIDLDKFKIVNDMYGHDVGDIVLQEVGKRLKSLENQQLVFARIGGDEFVGIYQNIDEDLINGLGERIDRVLEEHIVVSESEFNISASLGVARYPNDSDNLNDLLKLSDMAMYKAKNSSVQTATLISDELTEKLFERNKIEQLLQKMDVTTDLFLEYQPIFDLETGRLTSMEALVRWKYKGITIYPDDFIPVAEKIDFIKDITKWVFIHAIQQIGDWNKKYQTNYRMSLNVSDACIHNKIFFGNVEEMLKTFEVKDEWLILELTEHSIARSPGYMKELLTKIDDRGIWIYLDNFGTAPIILSDLIDYRIKGIKLAKKYVDDINEDACFSLVNSTTLLMNGLGIKSIAKGIERKEQYDLLKTMDFDRIQGFYFDKALSSEDFEKKYLA